MNSVVDVRFEGLIVQVLLCCLEMKREGPMSLM
jgi:hypothetical protein